MNRVDHENCAFYILGAILIWKTDGHIISRGGFGSGGSGFGEIHCPSVENKFTDNPSANRPLIGSGGRVG